MFRYAGILVIFLAMLAGCSPQYNWREARVAGGAVKAIFPDRPVTQQRKLEFSGHQVEFFLTTAKVNDVVFAVGYASLPAGLPDNDQLRRDFGQGVIRSLYQGLGVAVPKVLPDFGSRFAIDGTTPQGPARLEAKAWLLPQGLVEGMVTAAAGSYPQPEADEFFRSLVLTR